MCDSCITATSNGSVYSDIYGHLLGNHNLTVCILLRTKAQSLRNEICKLNLRLKSDLTTYHWYKLCLCNLKSVIMFSYTLLDNHQTSFFECDWKMNMTHEKTRLWRRPIRVQDQCGTIPVMMPISRRFEVAASQMEVLMSLVYTSNLTTRRRSYTCANVHVGITFYKYIQT